MRGKVLCAVAIGLLSIAGLVGLPSSAKGFPDAHPGPASEDTLYTMRGYLLTMTGDGTTANLGYTRSIAADASTSRGYLLSVSQDATSIGRVLGAYVSPTRSSPVALADGTTTVVVARHATLANSVRCMDLTATSATRVWLYSIATNGDATTLNIGWELPATGGRIPVPDRNFTYWQAPAGNTLSAKSVGGAAAIQVWTVQE
jgi:hypothetical protein